MSLPIRWNLAGSWQTSSVEWFSWNLNVTVVSNGPTIPRFCAQQSTEYTEFRKLCEKDASLKPACPLWDRRFWTLQLNVRLKSQTTFAFSCHVLSQVASLIRHLASNLVQRVVCGCFGENHRQAEYSCVNFCVCVCVLVSSYPVLLEVVKMSTIRH